jgi:hypothetical protein
LTTPDAYFEAVPMNRWEGHTFLTAEETILVLGEPNRKIEIRP